MSNRAAQIQNMLSGKVGLVTGGASGFGAGIVRHFVDQGAFVMIMDVDQAAAQQLVDTLTAGSAHFVSGDVSSETAWKNALAVAIEKFGKLDIVVNNAGVLHKAQPATELSEDEFDRLFRINVKSLFWSTKIIVPYFVDSSIPGRVVNISSTGAIRPRPNLAWYSATKGAVTTVTKALAAEWAKNHIRFNSVCPSVGNTEMLPLFLASDSSDAGRQKMLDSIPLGRICEPSDVAHVVCFLASNASDYVTGVSLEVDGGRCI